MVIIIEVSEPQSFIWTNIKMKKYKFNNHKEIGLVE